MYKKYSIAARACALICIIYLSSAMIISPTRAINAALRALHLCADTVIPSLFPFIFCGNMFIALGAARIMSRSLSRLMKPLFGVSGAGALALVLGIVSGYPVGAVCAASLYNSGECTKIEAERLIAFCNNSGPMFIIGAVGTGMLQNHSLGILLYLTHIFSALICGMIFRLWGREEKNKLLPPSRDEENIKTAVPELGAAVGKSVDTILTICGFIIIFAVFTAVIPDCDIKKYIYCLLEITGGVKELLQNGGFLPAVAFFIAFSGVSVLMQVLAIITPSGLSIMPYVLGKFTQAVIAFLLTYAAIRLTPQSIGVFSSADSLFTYPSKAALLSTSLIAIVLSAIGIGALIFISKIFTRYIK